MSKTGEEIVKVDFSNINEYQMYLDQLAMQMETVIYGMQDVGNRLTQMTDFSKTPPSGPTNEYTVLEKYISEMTKVLYSIHDMQYATSKYIEYYDKLGVYEQGNLVYDEAAVEQVLANFENTIINGAWSTSLTTNSFCFEVWEKGILAGVDFIDSDREQAVRYNKKILDELNDDLSQMKNTVIGYTEELRSSSGVYKVNLQPLADGTTVNSILQAFEIENIDYQMLKAETEILGSIKSKMADKNTEQLEILKYTYKNLIDDKLLDNFLMNCKKQIEIIGFENFINDTNRVKWLVANPRYEVNNFQTNLSPEQLRLLTEEVSYLLFHNDEKPRKPYFRHDIYEMLIAGSGSVLINEGDNEQFSIDTFTRFTEAGLEFEEVKSPSGESPWYIQEKGLEACVMRVNGEIVVMYPGSQEFKDDWIDTDIVPNLFHKVPEQYQIASDFAGEVKAAYPNDNIVLCGHSLAGGAVSYAGAENDINSFAIDPAPSVEGINNPDYDKGVTVVPGGKYGGLLNDVEMDDKGYYQSNTDIDIADAIAISSIFLPLYIINKYAQRNDIPSSNEGVYINSINEKTDVDDLDNPGYRDEYKGYFGDHMTGHLDEQLSGLYTPYSWEEYEKNKINTITNGRHA